MAEAPGMYSEHKIIDPYISSMSQTSSQTEEAIKVKEYKHTHTHSHTHTHTHTHTHSSEKNTSLYICQGPLRKRYNADA